MQVLASLYLSLYMPPPRVPEGLVVTYKSMRILDLGDAAFSITKSEIKYRPYLEVAAFDLFLKYGMEMIRRARRPSASFSFSHDSKARSSTNRMIWSRELIRRLQSRPERGSSWVGSQYQRQCWKVCIFGDLMIWVKVPSLNKILNQMCLCTQNADYTHVVYSIKNVKKVTEFSYRLPL